MSTPMTREISREQIADALQRGILNGEFAPGQRLIEADICETLAASRTTVRLALSDLVNQGIVEHTPHRGARVRVVSVEEALQIAEVRLMVESLCVARAAEKISDTEIVALRDMEARLVEYAGNGDMVGFARLTYQVFQTYVRIAKQPIAEEVLTRLRARNNRHRFRLSYRPNRARVSLPFWRAIIDAICRRNPADAQRALASLSQNVQETMQAIAGEFRQYRTPRRSGSARP